MTDVPLDILSLGAGVQSSTVLLMSCQGMLPKLDYAIFADTGWEPKSVYKHLWWLTEQATEAGIKVLTGNHGNIREDALVAMVRGTKRHQEKDGKKGKRWASLPCHTLSPKGSKGMIRRQCTREYKIDVVDRIIRRTIFGLKPRQRIPKGRHVRHWFGISADEPQRMRNSRHDWATNIYPLCGIPEDMLPNPMRRWDCMRWLEEHYPDIQVPRSACIGCPYHSNEEWRHLRDTDPAAWADAIEFDEKIRKCGGMRGDFFVHRSCVPLAEADIDSAEDKGQLTLWDNECEGMCGL